MSRYTKKYFKKIGLWDKIVAKMKKANFRIDENKVREVTSNFLADLSISNF